MTGKELERANNGAMERHNSGTRGDGTLIMEDAQIRFRNFAGAEGQYNREGDRNFCVLLDEPLAQEMIADGWNVKRLKPREGDEIGTAYIQVSIGFKGKRGGPIMAMITSKGRVNLCQRNPETGLIDEDEAVLFDWADILTVDLIIRPYHWNVNGKTGVKAYLKSMFVTINEDFLELKYAEVPDAIMSADNHENNVKAIEATGAALSAAANADQSAAWDDGDDIVDAEIMPEPEF